MAFKVKEDLTSQLLHYNVSVGAYMQMDQPRELVQEALALLIPRPVAEEVPQSPVGLLLMHVHMPLAQSQALTCLARACLQ